jgi:hypothetical protein
MKSVFLVMLIVITGRTATAHPHSGGIVVRPGGEVVAGDILGLRLLVIEPSGEWREIPGVGDIRGLSMSATGTVYGVTWGQGGGIWKLGNDERPTPVVSGFNGLFALGEQGSLLLAPADMHGHGQGLEILFANGQRSVLASLADIQAITRHERAIVVAAGSTIQTIDADGAIRTLAEDVGSGLYGLAMGPKGPIVTVQERRQVVELAPDGSRRVLLASDAPWSPTDVAVHEGMLYVVELAQHPCCWKGPRVRRFVVGQAPTTLLTIDDGDHVHISPRERPLQWMLAIGIIAMVVLFLGVARWRRVRHSTTAPSRG